MRRLPTNQILNLAATSLGFIVVQVDVSVVNTALERLRTSFETGIAALQWIVNAYTIVFAAFLLTAGAMGDRFGSRRIFITGFVLFTAASLVCGLAPDLGVLIAARATQGLGASLLVPTSLSLLYSAFPVAAERAKAVGIWASGAGLGIAAGPVVGGALTLWFGWRSIFLINVPIGILGVLLALRCDASAPQRRSGPLDILGQLWAILALCSLTGTIIEASPLGPTRLVVLVGALFFVISSGLFILTESRAARPMLPLGLFRSPICAAVIIVGALLNLTFYGSIFMFSLFFQVVRGYTPFQTGVAFLPLTILVAIINIWSGRLTARLGPGIPLLSGLLLGALGYICLLPLDAESSYLEICLQLVTIGAGAALAVPPMTAALLSAVDHTYSGIASGALNAARQIGGAIGVALFGLLLNAGSSEGLGNMHDALRSNGFMSGFHIAVVIAFIALLAASYVAYAGLAPKRQVSE